MDKIFGVRIDNTTLDEATDKVIKWARGFGWRKKMVTTPNPEIILEACKNKKFRRALNKAGLNTADGTGILWAAKYKKITEKNRSKIIKFLKWIISLFLALIYPKYIKSEFKERVTGADLVMEICKRISESEKDRKKLRIFMLGAREGVAEKAKEILEEKHEGLQISGTYAGTPLPRDEKEIIKKINNSKADILFVAYGAPAQELWMYRNLKKLKTVKVALGIGGTFDYIAGVRKRSPIWMQKIGLEWLYRLAIQPSRIKRIYNATIRFPLKVLKER